MLRLSAAAATRWPTASTLAALAGHPATLCEPAPAALVAPLPVARSPMFTRLWPSGASNAAAAKRLAA